MHSFVFVGELDENEVEYENNHSNAIKNETVTLEGASTKIAYARDALKRLTSISTTQDGIGYKRTFNYVPRGTATSPEGTTNYIKSVSYYNVLNNASSFEKTENVAYNNDGNIVTYGENTYVYDRIGRLVRENNKALDKTYTFVYNEGGNIVTKNEYVYTEELVLGTPTKIYAYTYGNGWKDQLSSFDGSTITYDIVGNPTSYLGVALTWTRGRLLNTYSKGRTTYTMNYNARGVRTSKIKETPSFNGINLETTNYTYDSEGRLRRETRNAFERIYLYSSDGIIGYEEDGEKFLYRKNLFGDVTAIYQGTTKVAEYVYDAWGNCTITYDPDGYGASNPIRYRGYYWDSDIKMYYLMTRYYDPKIGRFINADTPNYLDPETLGGLNLYSYCKNNPVMYVDPSGHFLITLGIIAFFVTAVAGAVLLIGTVAVYTMVFVSNTIKRLVETANEFVEYIKNDMTFSDVHDNSIGAEFNGSQKSSNIKNLYELYGGPGKDLTYAIYDEYGLDLD